MLEQKAHVLAAVSTVGTVADNRYSWASIMLIIIITQMPGSQDLQQFCIPMIVVHAHRIIICLNVYKDLGILILSYFLSQLYLLKAGKEPGDSPAIGSSNIWNLYL